MGIVLKQSFLNTIALVVGFAIGGVNTLFLYTRFLEKEYFGLIIFLLSAANILMPLMVFGMQNTIIKFYSSYQSKAEKDGFLINTLLLPLFFIIPLGIIGAFFYNSIANWLAEENPMIKSYTYLIFISAVFMGYFEVFYAWTKVQLNSVFGGFIKEVFTRLCAAIFLVAVYFDWLTNEQFIYAMVISYGVKALIMKLYAVYIYMPKLVFKIPNNIKEILSFSLYIIVAGSAAGILLEIDKFMIPKIEQIEEVAYYAVGVFIASAIAIPTRAMQQITSPITAQDMNQNKTIEVENLYKDTSINLLFIGGLLFLLINLNIDDLYEIINKPEFSKGIWIVFIISIAKLIELAIGTGNAILVNSKYYKFFFYTSLAMALSVVFLNDWLINLVGIDGAAIATLIVVAVYSFIKVLYIQSKLKMQPFSEKTLKLMAILLGVFLVFSFVNFNLHPIVSILIKSLLISAVYLFLTHLLNVSDLFNDLVSKYLSKK